MKKTLCNCTVIYNSTFLNSAVKIGVSSSDFVVLDLSKESLPSVQYHYTVIANNGTFTALVEGNFIAQTSKSLLLQRNLYKYYIARSMELMIPKCSFY